jgi:multidrug efflux pump subunit AcrB
MRTGFAGRVARFFLDSKLTPLVIAASLGLGALALIATPREEEPQIRVPMVDVMVAWPGAEPAEVESRIVVPLERTMWGIPGVEHVYSASRPGMGMVTVRFKVTSRTRRAWSRSTSGSRRWAGCCRATPCPRLSSCTRSTMSPS